MANQLLAPRDAGYLLGLTTSGVIKLARAGTLREIRDSAGRRLFRREDVERLRVERRRAQRGQTSSLRRRVR